MNKYVIDLEKRKKLGNFVKKIREGKNLGMNQLAIKIDITTSLLHRLENGQTQKISPFLIREVARGLRIDYKELYKIVGYLDEEDYNTNNVFEKVDERTELSKFTELVNSLPSEDMKKMLQEYLEKKELEAYKNGTFEEKKEHFNLIRKAIENGVEE